MENPGDEYSEEEDYQEQLDDQREQQEEEARGLGYPSSRKPDSLFTLFNKVMRVPDSSKVGNLDKGELGNLGISVRDCQRIGMLAEMLRHPKFAKFFNDTGEITLSTSASKKGWFVELFVTSKKFAAKTSSSGFNPQQSKWKLFGKNKNTGADQQGQQT